ncbi:hypothetical protein HZ31_000979 [Escherichia coli]|nr:hypothetical protein [Escherichia coli]
MKGYQFKNAYYANRQQNAEENVIKQMKRRIAELEGQNAVANGALRKAKQEIVAWQDRHDEILDELEELKNAPVKNVPAVVDMEKREKEIFAVYAKELAKRDERVNRALAAKDKYIAELEAIVFGM